MLFIAGITQGTKELLYQASTFVCSRCGRYGRYQVYMTYMCLSLFFIPIFKWNKKYYAKTTCCRTVYELDQEVGRRLEKGENLEIQPRDLTYVSGSDRGSGGRGTDGRGTDGWGADGWDAGDRGTDDCGTGGWNSRRKRCANCGYETEEDFEFCPKCGRKF